MAKRATKAKAAPETKTDETAVIEAINAEAAAQAEVNAAIANVTENAPTFESMLQSLIDARKAKSDSNAAHKLIIEHKEVWLVCHVLTHWKDHGDNTLTAKLIKQGKLSGVGKRAIMATVTCDYVTDGGNGRMTKPADKEDQPYEWDEAKLSLIQTCADSGDGWSCDALKAAFPTPTKTGAQIVSGTVDKILGSTKIDANEKREIANKILAALNGDSDYEPNF